MIERYTRPEMGRIWSEEYKFQKWLQVEVAVCEAWHELGLIPAEDLEVIRRARFDLGEWKAAFEETRHDVTAFLRVVTRDLGPAGRWVHYGLTSSDVMDTALSLQFVEAIDLLDRDLAALEEVVVGLARAHRDTLMVGRTHGVHAEPITFGFKLAGWVDEVRRNRRRLQAARSEVAVGKISGAVGTYAHVPPELEVLACRRLGLEPATTSTQVISRDRHAAVMTTLAVLAGSLERFATEIRHLQRTEVLEVEEPFRPGQTGSSAMPHKRNPELTERICGLARLVRAYAVTALENIALWHERDISHSSTERVAVPDAFIVLDYAIDLFTQVMRGLRVYPERMARNLELTGGLLYSQRLMLALIDRGLKREEAYRVVQRLAMQAWETGESFRKLVSSDPEVCRHLTAGDLAEVFDPAYFVRNIGEVYRRLGID